MTTTKCPEFTRLLRLRDAGADDELQIHLDACPECAAAWADLAALTALGQALPDGVPGARRRESVRTRLLAEADAAPLPRRPAGAWLALAAALVLGLGAWGLWPRGAQRAGHVEATADAVFALAAPGPDERVTLQEGRLTIAVDHLEPGQRFRVQTDDAEVEVRGTRFTVHAEGGRLRSVTVHEGLVEVRPHGAPTVRLGADERWTARPPRPAPTDAAPPPPRPKPRRARRRPPRRAPASTAPRPARAPSTAVAAAPATAAPASAAPSAPPPSPQTEAFEAGWRALRANRVDAAISAFSEAARLEGPLRQDAAWWHAVALGRARRDAETEAALTRFLRRWPRSRRRAEASVMLGWLHFSAGRAEAAEAAFRVGLGARREVVRARAAEGLEAVANWRLRPK